MKSFSATVVLLALLNSRIEEGASALQSDVSKRLRTEGDVYKTKARSSAASNAGRQNIILSGRRQRKETSYYDPVAEEPYDPYLGLIAREEASKADTGDYLSGRLPFRHLQDGSMSMEASSLPTSQPTTKPTIDVVDCSDVGITTCTQGAEESCDMACGNTDDGAIVPLPCSIKCNGHPGGEGVASCTIVSRGETVFRCRGPEPASSREPTDQPSDSPTNRPTDSATESPTPPAPTPTSSGNYNYCGTSWSDAAGKCDTACYDDTPTPCPDGEGCYADVASCPVVTGPGPSSGPAKEPTPSPVSSSVQPTIEQTAGSVDSTESSVATSSVAASTQTESSATALGASSLLVVSSAAFAVLQFI